MRRIAIALSVALLAAIPARAEEPVPTPPEIVMQCFLYLTSGTLSACGQGEATIGFVQQIEAGAVIRVTNLEQGVPTWLHTVTACETPCRRLPRDQVPTLRLNEDEEPLFDTGTIPIGGGTGTVDTAGLPPGLYEYFCTLHPWMRGAFTLA